MYSLKASMEKVRERTERIGANSSELREAFGSMKNITGF